MTHFFKGLVTELITSFNDDGAIDFKATGDLVEFQLENGVEHFFVNGLGGEGHEFSLEEKVEVLKTVYEKTKGKAKIMACVFESDVNTCKKLIDMYSEVDYDALCFTAPPLFPYTEEALYDYTSSLLKYTDKPCYIYNCVQMATLYSPEILERLYNNHENLYGYKDATRDMIHYMQCLMRIDPKKFDFLGGCDATIAPVMQMGAVGTVSFMGVPFPKETKAICDYALEGDFEKAYEAQFNILKLRNILKKSPFNAAYIYAQNFTGGPVARNTRMTKDMLFVSDEVKKELIDELTAQGYDIK